MVVDISERKRTEEALAKHWDEQATLYQLTDSLYRAETADHAYEAALDALSRALSCDRASVLLFDDSGVMQFVGWRGLSEEYRRAVEGHSPWTRDVKDPEPICVEDIETSDFPDPLKATVKKEGIGALAFIPVAANGVLVGKFMMYYPAPHVFSKGEVDLAVTIARQLGFSIERFRRKNFGAVLRIARSCLRAKSSIARRTCSPWCLPLSPGASSASIRWGMHRPQWSVACVRSAKRTSC
jgi:GAF domain-containing protein